MHILFEKLKTTKKNTKKEINLNFQNKNWINIKNMFIMIFE
jgi:hypothetical protein